jgi:hypothetical protein
LGRDAAAASEAWRETADASWAKIERSAREALADIETWLRHQSPPEENTEFHV